MQGVGVAVTLGDMVGNQRVVGSKFRYLWATFVAGSPPQ